MSAPLATGAKARAAACCWSGGPRLHAWHATLSPRLPIDPAAHTAPTNPPIPPSTEPLSHSMYLCSRPRAAPRDEFISLSPRALCPNQQIVNHPPVSATGLVCGGCVCARPRGSASHRMNYVFNNYCCTLSWFA
jgi:hypothetical protein